MGQFSWLDCITGEQVIDNKIRDVYVLVPKEFGGGHIHETCYDGYGRFGGQDIYELVVDWNRAHLEEYRNDHTFRCNWLQNTFSVEDALEKMDKRDIGISIACYDEDNERIHYPIKITHDPNAVYEDCKPSPGDPDQGWPHYEDEEKMWDFSILDPDCNIIQEGFDYETRELAETAAMAYIAENGITEYTLDVSQPDC